MNTIPPPQINRPPLALDEAQTRTILRKRHPEDHRDPFANDPHPDISRLGKLALRRREVNDLFTLGDLCARQTFDEKDARLLIFTPENPTPRIGAQQILPRIPTTTS